MSASNTLQSIQVTILSVAAAFGGSVVLFGHWWSSPPPAPPRIDIESIRQQVVSAMQDSFNTGEATKGYGLRIDNYKDMSLINVTGDGNEYHGLVHVKTAKATDVPIAFTLYADSATWIYDIDQASLIKLTTTAEQEESEQ